MGQPTNAWHLKLIDSTKASIKAALRDEAAVRTHGDRLGYLLARIAELQDEEAPEARLELFLSIIYALIEHEREARLTEGQIVQLHDLAESLLIVANVKPKSSQLSHLHGDLHLMLSQIYRRDGKFWPSAWEQQLAYYLSGPASPDRLGTDLLASGMRSLRLGHAGRAAQKFRNALEQPLAPRELWKARVGLVHTLRLMQEGGKARQLAQSFLGEKPDESFRLDLEWEILVCEAMTTGELSAMTAAVRRGKAHCLASYLLEAHLWTKCAVAREWEKRLPTVRHLARDPKLGLAQHKLWRNCVLQIERSYDSTLPLERRIQSLGRSLFRVGSLITIDKEVLMWGAAARWLSRTKAFELASLTLGEYEAKSLQLTMGKSRDVLGLLEDLFEKPWYQDRAAS